MHENVLDALFVFFLNYFFGFRSFFLIVILWILKNVPIFGVGYWLFWYVLIQGLIFCIILFGELGKIILLKYQANGNLLIELGYFRIFIQKIVLTELLGCDNKILWLFLDITAGCFNDWLWIFRCIIFFGIVLF